MFFSVVRLLSYHSRGTVMSYTDHSVQRRLKSNAPILSHVTWQSVIAASAVEESRFFISRYYRKCN